MKKVVAGIFVILLFCVSVHAAEDFSSGWAEHVAAGEVVFTPSGTTLSVTASDTGQYAWGNYAKKISGSLWEIATFNVSSVSGEFAMVGLRKHVARTLSGNRILVEAKLQSSNGSNSVQYKIRERLGDTFDDIRTLSSGFFGDSLGTWSSGDDIQLGVQYKDSVVYLYCSKFPDEVTQIRLPQIESALDSDVEVYAYSENGGSIAATISGLNVGSSLIPMDSFNGASFQIDYILADAMREKTDYFFDWAENTYTDIFPSKINSQELNLDSGNWHYRFYQQTGNAMGLDVTSFRSDGTGDEVFNDADIYVLGEAFGGLVKVDSLKNLLSQSLNSLPYIEFTPDSMVGKTYYWVLYDDFGWEEVGRKWNVAKVEFTNNSIATFTEINTPDSTSYQATYSIDDEGLLTFQFDFDDEPMGALRVLSESTDALTVCTGNKCLSDNALNKEYLFFDLERALGFASSQNANFTSLINPDEISEYLTLVIPEEAEMAISEEGKFPVVFFFQGSGGNNSRANAWSRWFAQYGVASVLINNAGVRGYDALFGVDYGGDLAPAIEVLGKTTNNLDLTHYAVMGFSRGGTAALESGDYLRPDVSIPDFVFSLYPGDEQGCPNTHSENTEINIFYGGLDEWGAYEGIRDTCASMTEQYDNAEFYLLSNAHHGYDGTGSGTFNCCGSVFRYEPNDAALSRTQEIILQKMRSKWQ